MKSFLLTVTAVFTVTAMIIFGLAPGFVSADEYSKGGAQSWGDKDHKAESMPLGVHSMGGTIESIDSKTGWMKIKTGMGDLTIHYPAPAVKDLKQGDKITVHLSYSKDDGMMKGDKMMMK